MSIHAASVNAAQRAAASATAAARATRVDAIGREATVAMGTADSWTQTTAVATADEEEGAVREAGAAIIATAERDIAERDRANDAEKALQEQRGRYASRLVKHGVSVVNACVSFIRSRVSSSSPTIEKYTSCCHYFCCMTAL